MQKGVLMLNNIAQAISEEYKKCYPANSLDENLGNDALSRIEGMAKAIKIFWEETELVDTENSFRDIYSEFKPTADTSVEVDQKEVVKQDFAQIKKLASMLADRILSDVRWYREKKKNIEEENKSNAYKKSSYLELHLALQVIKARLEMINDFSVVNKEA